MPAFEDLNTAKFLAELQGGSIEAFNRLVAELLAPLWRFLTANWTFPEADVEEIALDALLKVHSSVGSFRNTGKAKLTTWIFQIAQNLACDFYRAQRQPHEEFDEDTLPVRSDGQPAGRNMDFLIRLRDELEKFSANDQFLLNWRAREFSYAEIARWLGIKEVTARVRHLRALKRLRLACEQPELPEGSDAPEVQESGVAHG